MAQFDALTAQVAATTEVEASAVTLINGLAAKLLEYKDDPIMIAQLAEQLQASATALGAAVAANTEQPPA